MKARKEWIITICFFLLKYFKRSKCFLIELQANRTYDLWKNSARARVERAAITTAAYTCREPGSRTTWSPSGSPFFYFDIRVNCRSYQFTRTREKFPIHESFRLSTWIPRRLRKSSKTKVKFQRRDRAIASFLLEPTVFLFFKNIVTRKKKKNVCNMQSFTIHFSGSIIYGTRGSIISAPAFHAFLSDTIGLIEF